MKESSETVAYHNCIDDALTQWEKNNSILPPKKKGYSWLELIQSDPSYKTIAQFKEGRGFEVFGDWQTFIFEPSLSQYETFCDKMRRLVKE